MCDAVLRKAPHAHNGNISKEIDTRLTSFSGACFSDHIIPSSAGCAGPARDDGAARPADDDFVVEFADAANRDVDEEEALEEEARCLPAAFVSIANTLPSGQPLMVTVEYLRPELNL